MLYCRVNMFGCVTLSFLFSESIYLDHYELAAIGFICLKRGKGGTKGTTHKVESKSSQINITYVKHITYLCSESIIYS